MAPGLGMELSQGEKGPLLVPLLRQKGQRVDSSSDLTRKRKYMLGLRALLEQSLAQVKAWKKNQMSVSSSEAP